MSHRPLRASDKRRGGLSDNVPVKVRKAEDGAEVSDIFNDRRIPNGRGHANSLGKSRKAS